MKWEFHLKFVFMMERYLETISLSKILILLPHIRLIQKFLGGKILEASVTDKIYSLTKFLKLMSLFKSPS